MKRFLFFLFASISLVAFALVYHRILQKQRTESWAAGQVSKNIKESLSDIEKEAHTIKGDSLIRWSSLKNSFFLLDSGKVTAWSRNDLAFLANELIAAEDFSLTKFSKSVGLLRKWELGKQKVLVGIIPLSTDNRIVNQFIHPWLNPKIFPEGVNYNLSLDQPGVKVCVNRKCLFNVEMRQPEAANFVSLSASVVGIVLIVTVIFLIVRFWHTRKKYYWAFVSLFGLLALLRIGMVKFLIPSRFIKSIYFSPTYFASSSFNASVADFFLNSLIVAITCAYLFFIHSRLLNQFGLKSFPLLIQRLLPIAFLCISFFSFLFPFLFVEAIFHDSKIIFDISRNVSLDGMQIISIASVILGCMSSFFFVHFLVRWAMVLCKDARQFLLSLAFGLSIFVIYSIASDHNYWVTTALALGYISVLYFTDYFHSLNAVGFRGFAYLLIPIIFYSFQIAAANWRFTEERKIKSMQRFATSVLERDVLGEYLLDEAVKNIAADPFIQSSMSNPLLSKRSVRYKIKEKYLNNYFDRYHLRIALYKTDGVPADQNTETDLVSAIQSYANDANRTQYPNVYFVRGNLLQSATQYLAVINLSPSAGFIILELTLKRIIPRQTLPDLVIDNRFSQSFKPGDFNFAFYKDRSLLSSFGDFNFEKEVDFSFINSKAKNQSVRFGKYDLIATSDDNGRGVLVAALVYPLFMLLANFSFFFVIGIGIVFVLLLFLLTNEFVKGKPLSYTVRIQSFAYLAFILPLAAVSLISLRVINKSDEVQLVENTFRRGQLISEGISGLLSDSTDAEIEISLRNYLLDVARTSSFDLSVFDKDGKLIATSSPEIVEAGLVSNLSNRVAWERLVQDGMNSIQIPGRIGDLAYSSLFFSIRSELTGVTMGILELPFIRADEALNKSKVNVMANILVIFTGMFLLFTMVAIVSIDSFTWPFRLMAKTLKSTRIGGSKPLKWESNDEVGLMVKEYNQMLANLEKSKQAIEKNQRESAWREIAQQVAHEIKNPLTPIKLTLQQMEQNLPNGIEPERMERSIKNLLTHVDNLNDIATAFSSFAKMPSPEIKPVNVNEVVKEVTSLYTNQVNRKVTILNDLPCIVKGDPKLLSGIFSNIILNAFQSRAEHEQVDVDIDISARGETCVLAFKDNGNGISDELKEKIFIPHFSTKESGSGLGLAIAKQAVESMGGKIWFESQSKIGTTFFVELPLA